MHGGRRQPLSSMSPMSPIQQLSVSQSQTSRHTQTHRQTGRGCKKPSMLVVTHLEILTVYTDCRHRNWWWPSGQCTPDTQVNRSRSLIQIGPEIQFNSTIDTLDNLQYKLGQRFNQTPLLDTDIQYNWARDSFQVCSIPLTNATSQMQPHYSVTWATAFCMDLVHGLAARLDCLLPPYMSPASVFRVWSLHCQFSRCCLSLGELNLWRIHMVTVMSLPHSPLPGPATMSPAATSTLHPKEHRQCVLRHS